MTAQWSDVRRSKGAPERDECEHRTIITYSFSDPEHAESFGKVALWGCADCHRRFVPMPSDAPLPDVQP